MKKIFLPLLFICCTAVWAQPARPIIPAPVALKPGEGHFIITGNTAMDISQNPASLKPLAHYLQQAIAQLSGYNLPLAKTKNNFIALRIAPNTILGDEGYQMDVAATGITITAQNSRGVFYGIQSLLQTLPAIRTNEALRVPCMRITDYPRFQWRGMHLDVSRHFFSPSLVKEYINLMATYKFNTFHWHLTDDQGWRIQIKKYPKLTSVGAWRVDHNDKAWGERPQAKPGEPATYGGYYTQEQIKDIVAYAAKRNITIVPELDVPGHSAAAIAAYPFLSCNQKPQLPLTGGNYTGMSSSLCAGNDSVYQFLENVYAEVMALFPSTFIHVGGDEVDKTPWKHCAKCKAKIKQQGLKSEDELQSYFIKRMEKFIVSKKRRLIGWDEILEGGLAPEATVMSWRGEAGGIEAAKMGHDVVMTPGNPVYFDHYQADPATEPPAFGGFNTPKRVYDYEPLPAELTAAQQKHVLGAQANLWGESITTASHALYMVLPRMLALSEVVWSTKAQRNWSDFNERLQAHFTRMDALQLPYSKGNFRVEIKPVSQNSQLNVSLSTEAYKGEVYYTTDGSEPNIKSHHYTTPITINISATVKAVTVVDGKVMSKLPVSQSFVMHKAIGLAVKYTHPISRYYMADGPNSLTDGVRGTNIVGKYWHGLQGKDLIATVDLGESKNIQSIALGCLQNYSDWIMMPQRVIFETSEDGIHFTTVQTIENDVPQNEKAATIKTFTAGFAPAPARYVRVTAKALSGLPKGHSGEGKPAWIFADELMVN